ncbi:MAG: hypothetical protein LAO79_00485 [Acidobacteriia bacterium]|nr:hypothetical protein [Terriglobia bacterium]
MNFLALVLLFAAPFWEAKAPADWSEEELAQMFTDSPWAQALVAPASAPAVPAYFATAAPMAKAELERDRRHRAKRPDAPPDLLAEEYRAWFEENRATQIVLAIPTGNARAFDDSQSTREMEEQSVMRIGRRKIKMSGHFPPSPGDPYLRIAFPREVKENDKTVTFDLYIPGVAIPFRTVEFRVKDMIVNGKLEM